MTNANIKIEIDATLTNITEDDLQEFVSAYTEMIKERTNRFEEGMIRCHVEYGCCFSVEAYRKI
jgi:hypothetical protein